MKIKQIFNSPAIYLTTSPGLIKKINEDRLGIKEMPDKTRFCLCDGHWGNSAAQIAKLTILSTKLFPNNKQAALRLVSKIQAKIWRQFGRKNMNPETDKTPETSLIAIEIDDHLNLKIVSYGDCRLMISHQKKIKYFHKMMKTWLGAFSFLGLRHRLSVKRGVIFRKIQCETADLIWLFSDGIDECRYEIPTISPQNLVSLANKISGLKRLSLQIFKMVNNFGAEDNCSLGIIRC